MVSLGPLSTTKYCTHSCPFCYVQTHFDPYASMSIADISDWLKNQRKPFDIIYISGDTDSFAPPRADIAIKLLEKLCDFGVDLLFTTKALLFPQHIAALHEIQKFLARKHKFLFGCVSIAQLSMPYLEPEPIPSPQQRIEQLHNFRSNGLISVLTMRPFLPVVPADEYIKLVDLAKNFADLVLGEVWYADKEGILEQKVFRGPTPKEIKFTHHKMDFDGNKTTWKVFEAKDIKQRVKKHCQSLSIPFFMRSRPAIEWIRQHK